MFGSRANVSVPNLFCRWRPCCGRCPTKSSRHLPNYKRIGREGTALMTTALSSRNKLNSCEPSLVCSIPFLSTCTYVRSYTCPTVHTERKELSRAVDQQRMGALTSKLCSMRVLIANLMEVCVHFVTPLHAVDCQHCRKV